MIDKGNLTENPSGYTSFPFDLKTVSVQNATYFLNQTQKRLNYNNALTYQGFRQRAVIDYFEFLLYTTKRIFFSN